MGNEEKLKNFLTLKFPKNISAVYVICFEKDGKEAPLYIGETGRFLGRISDYISASFKATTDFKVGEAIKYLQKKGYRIVIKYRPTENRRSEQAKMIKYFQEQGHNLLNHLMGYDYKKADKEEEKKRVKRFCDNILANF